jgi:hypothetical protein
VERLERDAREEAPDTVEQLLSLLRVGDVPRPPGHRPVRDALGALEELIAPDVVAVLVRVDDAPRHGRPDPAEQLDHPARVGRSDCVSMTTPRPD